MLALLATKMASIIFVRMARELAGRHGLRDFICVIVGDGPALQSIRSLADELDVAKYVRFTVI
jgi:hypothetical protein